MSRRVDEARDLGFTQGELDYANHRTVCGDIPFKRRRYRAYLEGWNAGWWAAAFKEVGEITGRVNANIEKFRKQHNA